MLTPTWTMESILGARGAYHPRPPRCGSPWLPDSAAALDALTGAAIPVMGAMPILCARATATPDGLALLREAGLPVAAKLSIYTSAADYPTQLSRFAADYERLFVQHWHPAAELPAEHWAVPSRLISWLNNKAHLEELVPSEHVPRRGVLARSQLDGAGLALPCVIKAASDESSGGGCDVMVCRSKDHLLAAPARFCRAETVVVEEFLPIERNLCLNYAVRADASVVYLGAAEQVSSPDGLYQGNWLEGGFAEHTPVAQLGRCVARRGAELGYRGCLGVDVGLLENGAMAVFDLNFRANGSTVPLMLYPAVARRFGRPVARFRSWSTVRSHAELLRVVARLLERECFVPITTLDPAAGDYPGAQARVSGLLLGESREDVAERERELAGLLS
jgi:hypothetical protein